MNRRSAALALTAAVLSSLATSCSFSGEVKEVGSSPEPGFPTDERVLRDRLTTVTMLLLNPDFVERGCSALKDLTVQIARQKADALTRAGITPARVQTLNQAQTLCLSDPKTTRNLLLPLTGERP